MNLPGCPTSDSPTRTDALCLQVAGWQCEESTWKDYTTKISLGGFVKCFSRLEPHRNFRESDKIDKITLSDSSSPTFVNEENI